MKKIDTNYIKKVFGTNVRVRCINCQDIFWILDMYADLSEKPFIDYYCEKCKEEICGT